MANEERSEILVYLLWMNHSFTTSALWIRNSPVLSEQIILGGFTSNEPQN